ncbi:MAG: family 43 glycosylhydrolase [Mucilaginibacter polytrichastri]|nr:family 43 glycosylhydrolase [Mucilaginibacter polytrichastri]
MKLILHLFFPALFFLATSANAIAQKNDGAVIPGDFADPSIIKSGNTYYAVGTSSEWAPHFPIYRSADLKNWKQAGYVFDKAPEWTSGSFWAPEYYKIGDTFYIYYTARRKSDNVSYIGVATSKYPDHGFKDHGVVIEYGSEAIDAFITNVNGQLYVSFKAYGLDKRPIEILGSKLSADGLKLEGKPFSMLRDDERKGMEGQSIIHRDGYYYLFYSAGGCCGAQCSYNVRVARSKNFEGPYEKYSKNPLLFDNPAWTCMGHGSFVPLTGNRYAYLHHAYNRSSTVFTGRQGLLSELTWPVKGGWPVFKAQAIKGGPVADIHDDFKAARPDMHWQWDFRHAKPVVKQANGVLHLSGERIGENPAGVVLTTRPVSGHFAMSTTVVNANKALKGLSFYGDAGAALGLGLRGDSVIAWQVKDKEFRIVSAAKILPAKSVQLKLVSDGAKGCRAYYRQDKEQWKELGGTLATEHLPQWDRSPRMGLHVLGKPGEEAVFKGFDVVNE